MERPRLCRCDTNFEQCLKEHETSCISKNEALLGTDSILVCVLFEEMDMKGGAEMLSRLDKTAAILFHHQPH
jgi:hypothetical protein